MPIIAGRSAGLTQAELTRSGLFLCIKACFDFLQQPRGADEHQYFQKSQYENTDIKRLTSDVVPEINFYR